MSAIEWTEQTWNPITGCDRISEECDHCYALELAASLKRRGMKKYQRDGDPRTSGPGFGLAIHPETFEQPLRRKKPTMYFVNSMSDLFHKDIDPLTIGRIFNVMVRCPQHTFQVLTKRPKRMSRVVRAYYEVVRDDLEKPYPNVWLGTSIGLDKYCWRANHLRNTPAAVRFISAEPLLSALPSLDLTGIDWLITGGESGPNHRPIRPEWVRDLRDRCIGEGVAFFHKQWGGRTPKAGGRMLDGRTWDEYPKVEAA